MLTTVSNPYTDPHATLHFGDGPSLSLPTALLDKHPKLSSRCQWDMSLHLDDIPGGPGHVLVHYLLTGTYQCLKPKGSSPYEKCATEFATCVRVYAVAQEYELSTLETLAKGEIERLERDLSVTKLLDLMMDAHITPRADDIWLHNYFKSLVEPFIDKPLTPVISVFSESYGQTLSLTSILLKAMFELWHERIDAILSIPDRLVTFQFQEEPIDISPEKGPACNPRTRTNKFLYSFTGT
ncbi:hypothetical protein F5X99DRAFT_378822 [Biscogniauxia marginata]|nr:hypothetical protein F5X99DRAFT_378822 [Biscogniauxia marginata]